MQKLQGTYYRLEYVDNLKDVCISFGTHRSIADVRRSADVDILGNVRIRMYVPPCMTVYSNKKY